MKLFTLLFTIALYSHSVYSQNLPPEIHRNDSVWIQDVEIGVEAYVRFKGHLLTFQSKELRQFMQQLDSAFLADINHIDNIYKIEINNFKIGYSDFMLKNLDKLYGYSYLDMIIEFEKFLVYPNIYGVLLNPVRLAVNPTVDKTNRELCKVLLNKIQESIDKLQPEKIAIVKRCKAAFEKGVPERFHRINQGGISDYEMEEYRLIDFLILMNRIHGKPTGSN